MLLSLTTRNGNPKLYRQNCNNKRIIIASSSKGSSADAKIVAFVFVYVQLCLTQSSLNTRSVFLSCFENRKKGEILDFIEEQITNDANQPTSVQKSLDFGRANDRTTSSRSKRNIVFFTKTKDFAFYGKIFAFSLVRELCKVFFSKV